MPFYLYDQNNPGGFFHENEKLCRKVIIEADLESEANKKAESLGIYFNGVRDGIDRSCCGDRWYSPTEINFPHIGWDNEVFQDITEYVNDLQKYSSCAFMKINARIFYKNGDVQEFIHPKWEEKEKKEKKWNS